MQIQIKVTIKRIFQSRKNKACIKILLIQKANKSLEMLSLKDFTRIKRIDNKKNKC